MKIFACLLLMVVSRLLYAQNDAPDVTKPGHLETISDSLILSEEFHRLAAASDGGSGALQWLHSNKRGTTTTAGVAAFSEADSHWAVGSGGISFRITDRVNVQEEASVGGGHTSSTKFAYQVYSTGLSYKTQSRLYLKLGDKFLKIGEMRQNLLMPGVVLSLTERILADLNYAHSLGGNVGATFFLGRFDYRVRSVGLIGGFGIGRTARQSLSIGVGDQPVNEHFREIFGSVVIPWSGTELSLVADVTTLDTTRRLQATVSLRIPLKRKVKVPNEN